MKQDGRPVFATLLVGLQAPVTSQAQDRITVPLLQGPVLTTMQTAGVIMFLLQSELGVPSPLMATDFKGVFTFGELRLLPRLTRMLAQIQVQRILEELVTRLPDGHFWTSPQIVGTTGLPALW